MIVRMSHSCENSQSIKIALECRQSKGLKKISEKEILPQVTAFSAAYNSSLHPLGCSLQLASSLQLAAYSLHLPDCIPQFSPSSLHPPGCSLPPACNLQLAPSLQLAAFSLHPPSRLQPPACILQVAASSLHLPSSSQPVACVLDLIPSSLQLLAHISSRH